MATLIHKINLLLLEFDSIHDLRNICQIIYSDKLLVTLIDFCMNTENFANFGIRTLEIMSLEFSQRIARSEIFSVIQGLMRTNDYETVAQCLSFICVMAQNIGAKENEHKLHQKSQSAPISETQNPDKLVDPPPKLEDVITPKLVKLVLNTVSKNPEQSPIEFIHYALELVNTVILNTTLRNL